MVSSVLLVNNCRCKMEMVIRSSNHACGARKIRTESEERAQRNASSSIVLPMISDT